MKRMTSVLVLVLALSLVLVSCGGGGGSAVAGTWKLESVAQNGVNVDLSIVGLNEDSMEFVFDDKGKAEFGMGDERESGTYAVNGDTVTVTIQGEGVDLKLDGGKLVMSEDEGVTMTFAKK